MGWLILAVLVYLPIFYRIHQKIYMLEDELFELKRRLGMNEDE
ncbi:hypothetical protein [Priestia koreensis]|nr:hypothetical protein [Priestia koreensis]